MGQLPQGAMSLVQDAAEADAVAPPQTERLAFITQTTLSVDDTTEIVAASCAAASRPSSGTEAREDICYATTNRQAAVKAMAPGAATCAGGDRCSPNSSNSHAPCARLPPTTAVRPLGRCWCQRIEPTWIGHELGDVGSGLGITAGASAPELPGRRS